MGQKLSGKALASAAVIGAVALPFLAALGWNDYSHASQYISELGARGASNGALVSVGFAFVGILLLAATVRVMAAGDAPRLALVGFAGVGGGLGVSYVVSAFARCDPGCPETGDLSAAQQIHNAVGVIGYVAAIAGVLLFSIASRREPRWKRFATLGFVIAPLTLGLSLLTSSAEEWRGLLQRLVEVILLAWFWMACRQWEGPRTNPRSAGSEQRVTTVDQE